MFVRRSTLLLVLLLVGSVLGTSPAAAWQPQGGATFNTPKPWGGYLANYRIVRSVEQAINKTHGPTKRYPNPTIFISTYLLDRTQSVDAMVRACRRGVSVRVLLDQDIDNRNSRRLIRVLNSDNVRDKNRDGKPDRKPRRGPCDTRRKHTHADHHPGGGGKNHPHRKHHGGKNGGGNNGGRHTHASHHPGGGGQNHPHRKHHGGKNGQRGREKAGLALERAKRSDPLTAQEARRSASRAMPAPVTWGADRSYVKRCDGACRGAGGNMHSKFYLFSRTGKAKKVVMVSSSNLNRGGATMGWNDMYTVKRRPKLYDGFARMHRQMTNDRRAGAAKVQISDGPFTARFFPMRKASRKNDPTMQDLGRIRCRSAFGRTKIFVSMFYWKGGRGNYLATRLLSLARKGCEVSIVYGAPSVQLATRLRAAAGRNLIRLYDSRWDRNEDGFNEVRTHAKYVLVKGAYGRDRSAYRVLTGSQNWVAGSLSRGDEVTLNIALKSAYLDYARNWNTVRAHSRRLPYNKWGSPGRFMGPGYIEPI